MIALPNKLVLLTSALLMNGVAGIWLWRIRSQITTARLAGTSAAPILLCAISLMFYCGWWNGEAVYMADESMYILSSKYISARMWSDNSVSFIPGPDGVAASDVLCLYLVQSGDRVYPIYPIGWPFLLAVLGYGLSYPLAGPFLGSVVLLGIWVYCRRFLPEGTAGGAAWVSGLSASVLLNCVGFTSHAATGALLIFAAIALEYGIQSRKKQYAFFSVLLCALMISIRPLSGAITSCVALLVCWSHFRLGYTVLAGLSGGVIAASIMVIQNLNTTGIWYRNGYAQFIVDNNLYGWGPKQFTLVLLTLYRVADTIACSFPLASALVIVACIHPVTRRRSLWYILLCAAIVVAHCLMPLDSDSPIGERYYFEALMFVCIVAGMGWSVVNGYLGVRLNWVLPVVALSASAYPLWTLSMAHHRLRIPHASLLASKQWMGEDVDIVYLELSPAFQVHNYWVNPPRLQSARTLFIAAPRPERRDALAKALKRSTWRQYRFQDSDYRFVETGRSR